MGNKEIEKLALFFRKELIKGTDNKGFCFTISYHLSIYLQIKGFKNELEGNVSHFWIKINNNIIVDPTIRQFVKELEEWSKDLPLVYVGDKPKYKNKAIIHETIIDKNKEKFFEEAITNWKFPIFNNGKTKKDVDDEQAFKNMLDIMTSYDDERKGIECDLREIEKRSCPKKLKKHLEDILKINLKAAKIIYDEIKKDMTKQQEVIKKNKIIDDYFKNIDKIIKENKKEVEKLVEEHIIEDVISIKGFCKSLGIN